MCGICHHNSLLGYKVLLRATETFTKCMQFLPIVNHEDVATGSKSSNKGHFLTINTWYSIPYSLLNYYNAQSKAKVPAKAIFNSWICFVRKLNYCNGQPMARVSMKAIFIAFYDLLEKYFWCIWRGTNWPSIKFRLNGPSATSAIL